MTVQGFNSFDELTSHVDDVRRQAIEAAEQMRDRIIEAVDGALDQEDQSTYWFNPHPYYETSDTNLFVFARVVPKGEFMGQAENASEAEHYVNRWYDQLETGFLLTECFSAAFPSGEYGDTHITKLAMRITPELWEQARQDEWRLFRDPGAGTLTATGSIIAVMIAARLGVQ